MKVMSSSAGYMACQEQVVQCSQMYLLNIEMTITLTFMSGRHCCLWCHIRQDQLIEPPSVPGPVAARTTQSICKDHQKFVDAGALYKDAKFYNNCMRAILQ